MSTRITRITLLGVALLLLGIGTARADALELKVPFAFTVQGQSLPAGEYRVERPLNDSSVILLKGMQGERSAIYVMTSAASGRNPGGDTPGLTFARGEHGYELTSIWDSELIGREVYVRR